ncbi:MAG: tRNA (adenosine(37)-N6)-threonylcarbamoyltransferase complex transferase subunit TsaD [Clostridiales bacterium]|jgi:N6-L-threonylcarbamoyladenine synthase|nr:tRNA (adenosine(37)-N6)-threonylcarbamoyltransferase complex transferase subunit TsaD [Clostridiales bacterium]
MIILAVESSCDETAVAISENGRVILSDQVLSQADLHAVYGGVVPEIASRRHIEAVAGLADMALAEAGIGKKDVDAVAATYAPGLIGAVLVGLNFAKGAAFALDKPLIAVHHMRGHIAANYIAFPELEPPFLALVVSGGHSLIVDVRGYTQIEVLGTTRDDAAGECFDKCARALGLPYPGGAELDRLSQTGDSTKYALPRAQVQGNDLDMSFSGLKTAVINTIHNAAQKGIELDAPSLAASFAAAVSGELVPRTIKAAQRTGYKNICVCGGVAANSRVRSDLRAACTEYGFRLFAPPLKLCGDNAAMIACQAYYEYLSGNVASLDINGYANMSIS